MDCPRCGVRQPDVVYVESKSRVIAAWLALLLGFIGVHRFYLGQIGWGIVYVLFFWTLIPSIVAIFEAVYYLSRSNEQWARMYGGPVRQPNGIGLGCGWILAILALLNIAFTVFLLFSVF
jgi:TM2 domain-containing membrane protein YozV